MTRARAWRAFAVVAATSLGCAAGILLAPMGAVEDLGGLPRLPLIAHSLACVTVFGLQLGLSMVPRRGETTPRLTGFRARAILIAAAVALLGVIFGELMPPCAVPSGPGIVPFVSDALPCIARGALTSIVPIGLALYVLRHSLPDGARPIATQIGAAAGALSGFVLHLTCPVRGLSHLVLVHGGLVMAPALLVGIVGARLLAKPKPPASD
jgi:hypothetical protein